MRSNQSRKGIQTTRGQCRQLQEAAFVKLCAWHMWHSTNLRPIYKHYAVSSWIGVPSYCTLTECANPTCQHLLEWAS